jgi:hypothetical protein
MVKQVFVARDGSQFDNEADALAHEKKISPGERTLVFSGHSDDVILIDNCHGQGRNEEVYSSPICVMESKENRVYVHVEYGKGRSGCWMVGIGPVDEDESMPEWANPKISFDGYTAVLEMDVPADVYVVIPGEDE